MIEILLLLLSINLLQFSSARLPDDKMALVYGNICFIDKSVADDEEILKYYGYTAAINCVPKYNVTYKDIKTLNLGVKIKSYEKLFPKIEEGYEFLNKHLENGGRVLLITARGDGLAPALTIYYVMRDLGYKYDKALRFVNSNRPSTRTYDHYARELREYSEPKKPKREKKKFKKDLIKNQVSKTIN